MQQVNHAGSRCWVVDDVRLEAASADRLDEEVDAAAQVAAEIREPFMRWITRTVRGCLAIAHDDLEQGEKDTIEDQQIARDGGLPDTEVAYGSVAFHYSVASGSSRRVLGPYARRRCAGAGCSRLAGAAVGRTVSGDRQRPILDTAARASAPLRWTVAGACVGRRCRARRAELRGDPLRKASSLEGPLQADPFPFTASASAPEGSSCCWETPRPQIRHFAGSMRVHEAIRSPFGTVETAFHRGHFLLDRDHERARNLLGPPCKSLAGIASVTSSGAPMRPFEPDERNRIRDAAA